MCLSPLPKHPAGREAIGEKKYGEAADYLSAALARMVEQHGELATE